MKRWLFITVSVLSLMLFIVTTAWWWLRYSYYDGLRFYPAKHLVQISTYQGLLELDFGDAIYSTDVARHAATRQFLDDLSTVYWSHMMATPTDRFPPPHSILGFGFGSSQERVRIRRKISKNISFATGGLWQGVVKNSDMTFAQAKSAARNAGRR